MRLSFLPSCFAVLAFVSLANSVTAGECGAAVTIETGTCAGGVSAYTYDDWAWSLEDCGGCGYGVKVLATSNPLPIIPPLPDTERVVTWTFSSDACDSAPSTQTLTCPGGGTLIAISAYCGSCE